MDAKQIIEYAKKSEVFTTEDTITNLHINDNEKNALNIFMHRMCEKGEFYRYEPGIYGYMKYNTFAKKKMPPAKTEVVNKVYLKNGEGYVSGGHYLNMVGLSTWCPSKRIIVSNKVKRNAEKYNTIIKKPKTTVTIENMKYLQLLDGIEDLFELPIDNNNPGRIIFKLFKQLDIYYLIYLAQNYYPKKVSNYIIKIIGEVHDHETA